MGGEGSGRKPDLANAILRESQEKRTPIALQGDGIYLPNYSGLKDAVRKDGVGSDTLVVKELWVDNPSSPTIRFVEEGSGTGVLSFSGASQKLSFNLDFDIALSTSTGSLYVSNNTTLNSLTASKPVFTDANKTLTSTGTIPIAQGGTNNTSTYTDGSVIFSNGTSLTQDNSNFNYSNVNDSLNITNLSGSKVIASTYLSGANIYGRELKIGTYDEYIKYSWETYDGSNYITTITPLWTAGGSVPYVLQRGGIFLQGDVATGTGVLDFLYNDGTNEIAMRLKEDDASIEVSQNFKALGSISGSQLWAKTGYTGTITTGSLVGKTITVSGGVIIGFA
jgi:hypothetical protein